MSLERIDQFFGSDKSKQTLLRTQQAFQIAVTVQERTGVPVRVVIRDTTVLLEVDHPSTATVLRQFQPEAEQIVAGIIGRKLPTKVRIKKPGRLD